MRVDFLYVRHGETQITEEELAQIRMENED